ncbi:hypothetical protein GCG21_02135 [Pseudactinotalea sp. HY160]|uniref:uracil-xanthine permease family protein n=1 Tax=Pseudactinotalea sp. HY160 TaxID=2654490 RepID=UPI00128DDB03|nr:solute carrier family 23 protein [Pseudactinotalea sp. HY160]MPV48827.1 hypothetical protein [Pseudactinotalea sp. HY160]
MSSQEAPDHVTEAENTPIAGDQAIEENLPVVRTLGLGAQQVLVSNAWLDAIFIASIAGLTTALATNLLSATFIAAGVATFVQTLKLVRLPIFEGPSSAFSPLAIGYAKAGTLASASTGLIIGAALTFLLAVTGLLTKFRAIMTRQVTGTIITLVGFALAGYTFMQFFGMPGTSTFGTGPTLLIACLTTAIVLTGSALGGKVRAFSFLIALAVGDILAGLFGMLDFSAVGEVAWLAFPTLLPYGALSFDLGITVTMTIVFFVAVIEAIGMYEATAAFTGTKLTNRRINAGIAGEAGGSMLSAFFGGFGTTAYAQNLGVVRLTGVASRHVMRYAAIIMIALAFFPKVAAVLVATPSAVIGGMFLPAAATVVLTGIGMIAQERGNITHNLVAPLGIMAGLGIPVIADDLIPVLPSILADLVPHQIIVGTIVVIFLEIVLVKIPGAFSRRRTRASA